jgi:uncharacterized protein (TIGR00288 family)
MPSSSDSDRVAVLIDADNTSPKHASALLEEVAKYGVATVKRAYGDWTTTQLAGWKSKLNQHAVQPMQQFAYTTGKNSTDSALIIDAMDLLYSGSVDAFAIVSSDSDFTRLATRLRESGMKVIGLGLRKTPQSLVSACDRFVYLELLDADEAGDEPATEVGRAAGEAPVKLPDLRRLLVNAVNGASHDDGWASLSAVGSHISRSNPSFDPRNHGAVKLVDLARAQTYLEVVQADDGPVRIRLLPKGAAKKAAAAKTSTRSRKAADLTPAEVAAELPAAVAGATVTPEATPPVVKKATRSRSRKAVVAKTAAPQVAPEPEPTEVAPEPPKVTTRTRSRRAASAPE